MRIRTFLSLYQYYIGVRLSHLHVCRYRGKKTLSDVFRRFQKKNIYIEMEVDYNSL